MTIPQAAVIPAPVFQRDGDGWYTLSPASAIEAHGDAAPVGEYLAALLGQVTGFVLPLGSVHDRDVHDRDVHDRDVHDGDAHDSGATAITLTIVPGHPAGGYGLEVAGSGIHLVASEPAGLFAGAQSLRQLLGVPVPSTTEYRIPATQIRDHPRFAYRGAMLDVARHFFGVDDVKRFVDLIALLKLNILHLHLTDDQGWRIQIDSWPRLTEHGGSTQVGGGSGGFYTKSEYREIVDYAASRYITVVPEIDLPGHTNAALASYPELNCDGIAPDLYEGTEVGFSSLCIGSASTQQFVNDVISEVAGLTPGPWIHIGGDESLATSEPDFVEFVNQAAAIVVANGKTAIGWHEMGRSTGLPTGTIGQYWSYTTPQDDAEALSRNFIAGGGTLIMSPADVAYLDIKYDGSSQLGVDWADGPTSMSDAYLWDPAGILLGVGDDKILGVEAPLWTETVVTMADLEWLVFPRIAAIAEIAWSPKRTRDFTEFSSRLEHFYPVLDSLGVNYFRAAPASESNAD